MKIAEKQHKHKVVRGTLFENFWCKASLITSDWFKSSSSGLILMVSLIFTNTNILASCCTGQEDIKEL